MKIEGYGDQELVLNKGSYVSTESASTLGLYGSINSSHAGCTLFFNCTWGTLGISLRRSLLYFSRQPALPHAGVDWYWLLCKPWLDPISGSRYAEVAE
jgi:hypothetical protein